MELDAGHVLAFMAGLSFAANDVMTRILSRDVERETLVAISLLVGSPFLWIAGLAKGETIQGIEPVMVFAAIGLLHFGLARYLFYTAIAGLGAASAAITTSPVPVLSSMIAWAALGEELSIYDLAGIILVAAAILIVGLKPSGRPLQGVSSLKGLAAGLAASLIFSITSVLVRGATTEYNIAVLGAALSYTAAIPVILALARSRGSSLLVRRRDAIGVLAYVSGIIVATAQLLRYEALSRIPVAEAVILISLFPFHAMLLSKLLSDMGEEDVRASHVLAGVLAVAGVILNVLG